MLPYTKKVIKISFSQVENSSMKDKRESIKYITILLISDNKIAKVVN